MDPAANPMSLGEVDRALTEIGNAHDRIATDLYAIDTDPTHEYLRSTPVTGATAIAWAGARTHLDRAWQQLNALREILDLARAVRSSRSRPDRGRLVELTVLLRAPVVVLDADGIPLPLPADGTLPISAAAPASGASRITVTVLSDRLELACRDVRSVLSTIGRALIEVVDMVADLDNAVATARAEVVALGLAGTDPAHAALDRLDRQLTAARADGLGDPVGTGRRADRLDRPDLTALQRRLADLARLRAEYPARLAALRRCVEELSAVEEATGATYETVTVKILDPRLPPTVPVAPELRGRLDELELHGGDERWPLLDSLLPALEDAVTAALAGARDRLGYAEGLLARRDELRGRLQAYRSKAVRLGLVEEAEVSGRYRLARTLLWTAPCDLPAATRAVVAYQRALVDGAPHE